VTGMPITPNISFTPSLARARATKKQPSLGCREKSIAGAEPEPPARADKGCRGSVGKHVTDTLSERFQLQAPCSDSAS
jgi:hypothetical protein